LKVTHPADRIWAIAVNLQAVALRGDKDAYYQLLDEITPNKELMLEYINSHIPIGDCRSWLYGSLAYASALIEDPEMHGLFYSSIQKNCGTDIVSDIIALQLQRKIFKYKKSMMAPSSSEAKDLLTGRTNWNSFKDFAELYPLISEFSNETDPNPYELFSAMKGNKVNTNFEAEGVPLHKLDEVIDKHIKIAESSKHKPDKSEVEIDPRKLLEAIKRGMPVDFDNLEKAMEKKP